MAHIEKNEFAIEVKVDNIGYVRVGKIFKNRHEAKSKAGKIFHVDYVKSVCVHDGAGISHLYLKRNDDGTVLREELA